MSEHRGTIGGMRAIRRWWQRFWEPARVRGQELRKRVWGDIWPWVSWRILRLAVFVRLVTLYPRILVYALAHIARSGFSSPGHVLAYLSIVATVVLGLLGVFQEALAWSDAGKWAAGVIVVALAVLIVAIGMSFLSQPPGRLAKVRVEGKKASEILMVLAATNYSLVWKSERRVRGLAAGLTALQNRLYESVSGPAMLDLHIEAGWKQEGRRIRHFQRSLVRLKKDQVREIQLIEEMVKVAGRALDVRPERLCGAILHFSPILFRERIQELFLKTMTLIDALDQFEKEERPGSRDFHALVEAHIDQIQAIIQESARRLRFQMQIMDNHYVNDLAMEVVAARSASLAVTRYAECLAQAHLAMDKRWKLPGGRKEQIHEMLFHRLVPRFIEPAAALPFIEPEALAHRIRYLFRLQKAYPGVNPHVLLTRLVKALHRSPKVRHREWCEPRVARQVLVGLLALESRNQRFDGLLLARLDNGRGEELGHWKELPRLVAFYSKSELAQIVAGFRHYLASWVEARRGRCYIVTQGHSATVNRALQAAAPHFSQAERQRMALVCFPSHGDELLLEPRRIIYSLAESDVASSVRRRSAILKPSTFVRLLKPGDSVMLLLGTEAIDKEWCFVHPYGLSLFQDELRTQCEEREVRYQSVVLAETYKRQSFRWADLDIQGDHIDHRVEMFSAEDQHVDRLFIGGLSFVRRPRPARVPAREGLRRAG